MDNHGLLSLTQTLATAMHEVTAERKLAARWSWHVTPLIFPESRCPYCSVVIRSPYIWFLSGTNLNILLGAFEPKKDTKIVLIDPSHPHTMGGGRICLGSHTNGAALFASGPNLRDLPLGFGRTACWVNKYWGPHYCAQLEAEVKKFDYDSGYSLTKDIIR